MYGKLICVAVAICFLYVQLGASLECFSCDGPQNCKKPTVITCDQNYANDTVKHINKYFIGQSPYPNNNNFDCLHQNYTQNNQLNMTYSGCMYQNTQACQLNMNASYITLARQNCTQCSGNRCNGRNPAGTYSSSLFTMFASIVGVVIAKMFVM